MLKNLGKLVLFLIFGGGVFYHFVYSAPAQQSHGMRDLLAELTNMVGTQVPDLVITELRFSFTDNARIHMEVNFPPPPGQKTPIKLAQDFDRDSFVRYIQNLLANTNHYAFESAMGSSHYDENLKATIVEFTAKEQVYTHGLATKTSTMNYIGSSQCAAMVAERPAASAHDHLLSLTCVTNMYVTPVAPPQPGTTLHP
jgi:hypothetical protein